MAEWLTNKPNYKQRGDYGVRVARPGFDAGNCAQNQLLFNSNWAIIQIVAVIDMRDELAKYSYTLRTVTTTYDSSTGERTYDATEEVVSAPPAGYISEYEDSSYDERRSVAVNRKYVQRTPNLPSTSYYYQDQTSTVGTVTTTISRTCTKKASIPKKRHNLGYTPFFMASQWVSNISGYVLLFSLDIRRDIDYPYTEAALPLLSPTGDYGIKSDSIFGENVPGLCSNMFSKLVQAVKTEESNRGDRNMSSTDRDDRIIWNPVYEDDKTKVPDGVFAEYEMYAFVLANGSQAVPDDGGDYFIMSYLVFMPKDNFAAVRSSWAVTTTSFQTNYEGANSLVVLRKPMVSPEYEEITI